MARVKAPPVKVVSRFVTQRDKYGRRLQRTRWGKWMVWDKKKTTEGNIREAVDYANFTLKIWKSGTVVYVKRGYGEPVPIYQAKYGNDGSYFTAWKPNPLAEYWRRRI